MGKSQDYNVTKSRSSPNTTASFVGKLSKMDSNSEEIMDTEKASMTLQALFLSSVLMSPLSLPQFQFFEDEDASKGHDRRILLAEDGDPALFYVPGIITLLKVMAAGAIKKRKSGASLDEYSVRLRIDNEATLGR